MTYIDIINQWNNQAGIEKTWDQLSEAEKVQFAYTLGLSTMLEKPSIAPKFEEAKDKFKGLFERGRKDLEEALQKGKSAAVLFSEQFEGKWNELLKKNPNVAILQNWSCASAPNANPYLAPELIPTVLYGKIYNDPRFKDGTMIHTSRPVGIDGDCVVTRSGTRYLLGVVDELYERNYPNARERVFRTLSEIKG